MKAVRLLSALTLGAAVTAACALSGFAFPDKEGKKAEKPVKAEAALYCPVTGEEIAGVAQAGGKIVYEGKTYYVCCAGCEPTFKKSPAKFVKLSGLREELRAAQSRVKALQSEIEAVEKGAAAAATETKKAEATPAVAASTLVYCAVRGEEIASPAAAKGSAEYNGKTYYFCCGGCKGTFAKDSAKFAALADERAAKRATAQ